MKNRHLINTLSQNIKPIKVIAPLWKRLLMWMMIAILTTGLWLWMMKLRTDLDRMLTTPLFLIELFLLALLLIFSGFCLLSASIPGRLKKIHLYQLVGLWVSWKLNLLISLSAKHYKLTIMDPFYVYSCGIIVTAVAVIPAIVLFIWMKKAAPLNKKLTIGLMGSCSGLIGLTTITLYCHITELVHILLWHGSPVLIITIIGVLCGKKLLR